MKKQKNGHITGVLGLTYEGYGFVIPEKPGLPDLFVPAHAIGDALHKDRVEVTAQKGRYGKTEGRITKILERGLTQLVGRYEVRGQSAIVVAEDLRVRRQVIIPPRRDKGARHNEMVVVKILEYPSAGRPIKGEVIKRLGSRGSDQTELNILIARHQLPGPFSDGVLSEAREASEKFWKEVQGEREDLTHLPFITIDGEDAADFDDAVCAARLDSQSVRVWVSIADVSHFVREGSGLDNEALARGTSAYFPGVCIPMLPEDLSNNICSLVPNERRYCFTAEMVIDSEGVTHNHRFYKSVVKSAYRMTYTEANSLLSLRASEDERSNPPSPPHVILSAAKNLPSPPPSLRAQRSNPPNKEILSSLTHLNCAASYFRKGRRARGSIDFDLPEPQVILDLTGRPENIVKAERNIAHMLIEDLMIAANEAVALYLTRRGYPCMYRVHDRPDPEKLIELKVLLKYLGHDVSIGKDPTPKRLAKIVRLIQGRPEERLINMLLLRSMAQAVYSTQNIGHFGLASRCYCHFTSPIRRYPDLLVHRLLDHAVGAASAPRSSVGAASAPRSSPHRGGSYLKQQAEHSSKMERKSMEAEREALNLYSAIFMRDKIGEVYDGLVSHAAKKGLFVELIDYFVEGMIKPEDLVGDHYRFEPKRFSYVGRKTGRSIHIGDKIRVQVKDVSIEERRIYFEPMD